MPRPNPLHVESKILGMNPMDDLAFSELQRSVWSGVLSLHRQVIGEKSAFPHF